MAGYVALGGWRSSAATGRLITGEVAIGPRINAVIVGWVLAGLGLVVAGTSVAFVVGSGRSHLAVARGLELSSQVGELDRALDVVGRLARFASRSPDGAWLDEAAAVREALGRIDSSDHATSHHRELVIRVDALLTQAERARERGLQQGGAATDTDASAGFLSQARQRVRELEERERQRLAGVAVVGRRQTWRVGAVLAAGLLMICAAWVVLARTARKTAELAMRNELTDLLAAAVRSTEEGILISDTGGRRDEPTIVFINDSFKAMAGHPDEELVGRPLRTLRETCLREREFSLLEHSYSDSRSATMETVRWREDGSRVHCEWHISPVRSDPGRVTHFISVLRDITKLREHEEAQRQSHQDLVEAHRQLQENQRQLIQSEKMASLGQLAAGVAHEINNPVGYVMSNLETLQEDIEKIEQAWSELREVATSDVEDRQERLDRLEDRCARLGAVDLPSDVDAMLRESYAGLVQVKDIVQGLKNFARPDDAEVEEADLNREIEAALKIVWNELKHKCTVTRNLGDLPPVRCRPGQLNQVFTNLLVNAAQAITGSGEITIETRVEGSQVVVSVADSGVGIPADHLSDLFNPFFTTKPAGTGTGLGLAVSYGIVEKHSGTIDVQSEFGEGSVFTVRLPING